jgi:hypothetical protein
MRRALAGAGIDARTASELVGSAVQALDFGLAWKNGQASRSIENGGPVTGGEG